MRYYIADLHFYHEAINSRMDCRGFADAAQMNAYMIEKWNGKVRKKDDVVIIGDLSWGNVQETNALLEQLNGRLYLIRGNHDRFLSKRDANIERFKWVKPYEELSDNGRKVVLCHYPIIRTGILKLICSMDMCMTRRTRDFWNSFRKSPDRQ